MQLQSARDLKSDIAKECKMYKVLVNLEWSSISLGFSVCFFVCHRGLIVPCWCQATARIALAPNLDLDQPHSWKLLDIQSAGIDQCVSSR